MVERKLGNIYGFTGGNYAGNVYDQEFLSPTINTCQGGGKQPMIVEQLGFIDNGTGKHQSNTVYSEDGLSPSITTITGGGTQQIKICESQIVAMRGRNPDNPSDRSKCANMEQRLEPNMKGTSNCLTSVQKDNLVMETVKIKQATKDGYIECNVGSVFDASYPDSITRRGRVQDSGNTCPTITAQSQELCHVESAYRIRKLTPRECGRLMGVSDEDISKMEEVNSNTQLYKQFGNSIVVAVMEAMFKNLGINQSQKGNQNGNSR